MKWTADSIASLPPAQRTALRTEIARLPIEQRASLAWSWEFAARPSQRLPSGEWIYWLLQCGRGFGKTRTGAETVRHWIKQGHNYVNLIGATADDARDVMVTGESGILAVCPPWERPRYLPSQRKLEWQNGAESLIFTADEPDRLRGKQAQKLWCFCRGTMVSTPNGAIPIEALRVGDTVSTRFGPRRITAVGDRQAVVGLTRFSDGSELVGTREHPVLTSYGWTRLDRLFVGQFVATATSARTLASVESAASARTFTSIVGYGNASEAQSRHGLTFTTKTETHSTTRSTTSTALRKRSIAAFTAFRCAVGSAVHSLATWLANAFGADARCSLRATKMHQNARGATRSSPTRNVSQTDRVRFAGLSSAPVKDSFAVSVASTWAPAGRDTVYDITVDGAREFIANGIIVHNCDELAAWHYADAWDQAKFGLRLGTHPQAIITTTPRPTALVKGIIADPHTIVTRGATIENRANLAKPFIDAIIAKYEGTRLGRQEINGEILEDNPGALFKRDDIDRNRVVAAPDLRRIVVAIDPAAKSVEGSDDTGIVVAGVADVEGKTHGFVLDDCTMSLAKPEEWASKAVEVFRTWEADRIVAEGNNGGEMIESVIRAKDGNVPVTIVSATRGKEIRAEPVSALYEQCIAKGTLIATSLGDVPIEQVAAGDFVWTRAGLRRVQWAGQTGLRDTLTIRAGSHLVRCTDDHPVFVHGRGFIHARHIVPKKDIILSWNTNARIADAKLAVPPGASHARLNCGGKRAPQNGLLLRWKASAITNSGMVTGAQVGTKGTSFYTERSGRASTARSIPIAIFTTLTAIKATTLSKIWPLFRRAITRKNILGNPRQMLSGLGSQPRESNGGPIELPPLTFATNAKVSSCPQQHEFDSVPRGAIRTIGIDSVSSGPLVPVYDLTIEGQPEYFAGGILVHNCRIHHVGNFAKLEDELCEWDPQDKTASSPNRLDAVVWAITALMLTEDGSAIIDFYRQQASRLKKN